MKKSFIQRMEASLKMFITIVNIEIWKHWTVTLTFEISQIKSFQKLSTAGGEGTIFVLKDLGGNPHHQESIVSWAS